MTTHTKYTDTTSKLYRMLEGIGKDVRAIGATVRSINDAVSDLTAMTDSIYDAINRHPESRTDSMTDNSFWGEEE